MRYRLLLWAFCLLTGINGTGQELIDLSGQWSVELENRDDTLYNHLEGNFSGTVNLPGSLAENKLGYRTIGSDYGILTPEYKYIGKARYSRNVTIPKSWKGKTIELVLERVLWESRVIVDGMEISRQDALGMVHIHNLGELSPGEHTLTILVDNDMIHNIGDKGHAYGEYTQGIWNGVVGIMELRAFDALRISSVRTFPDLENEQLIIEYTVDIKNQKKGKLGYEIVSLADQQVIISGESEQTFKGGEEKISLQIPVGEKLEQWSEFNPLTYLLRSHITAGRESGTHETEFGYFTVGHDGTKILINGSPVFLRGNLDCVHFPLTGYPSCDTEAWENIFRIYKQYGLNHARFHSWCPPEAAFIAADRLGIYLQVEASIWIDWWMTEDMKLQGRPEMDTRGHPMGLGYEPARDSFVVAEMNRMVDVYGNHPSFTMFCIGNELGNSDFRVIEKWVSDLKQKDPRRLYSVSTAREITYADDYSATHSIRDIGRTRGLNGPRTNWDFEESYSKMDIPIIAHEIGQWPVYPQWSEIEKYSGVLKARNFEEFRVVAREHGIEKQDHEFAMASGALNQIMYKYETESFLRTKSCAGVQLLSMQDYQGQGEALIGWLDAHWDSKGITTPEKFREHFDLCVPLLRFEKYVWKSSESFRAAADLSFHGKEPITAGCKWTISGADGRILDHGTFVNKSYPPGSLTALGEISFSLNDLKRAEKLNVTLEVSGTNYQNSWDIWVYPDELPASENGDVFVTTSLDREAREILDKGGKVLLNAHRLGSVETSVQAHFYPLYWSLTFFPGQGKTCIGLLLDNNHPAFMDFPTAFHSDWQWESISFNAKGFILNDLPHDYRAIAQPVDDFHRNNKLGSIFELKVGEGSLLVCGYNLDSGLPVAEQLKFSLMKYMISDEFSPVTEMDVDWLEHQFSTDSEADSD